MSYKVIENDGKHNIIESGTDLIVHTVKSKEEATKLCRSLNLGSGFAGFTPPFFTERYVSP